MAIYRIHGSFDEDIEADSEDEALDEFYRNHDIGEYLICEEVEE